MQIDIVNIAGKKVGQADLAAGVDVEIKLA